MTFWSHTRTSSILFSFRVEFSSGLNVPVVAARSICLLPSNLLFSKSSIMVEKILILAFLAAVRLSAGETAQTPLVSPLWTYSFNSDTYKFEWPIHKIAIVGAGPRYFVLQSERISTIHLDLQWAHCLSGVLSGRLRRSCV
jgi:hypothetical protein